MNFLVKNGIDIGVSLFITKVVDIDFRYIEVII